MEGFREENRFFILLVNFSGLYLKSIESVYNKKWLLIFLTFWTKIETALAPIYISSAVKFLIFDEASFAVKIIVFRRLVMFSTFFFKNVFFYLRRSEIEDLIDLWDSYFKEDLYQESRLEKLRENQKRNLTIFSLSWAVTLAASLLYTAPLFFAKDKKLNRPSGIPYRHQSPDFELMVVFDFFRIFMGLLSAISLDCILMVFLSLVLVQLTHLKDTLADMVNEISVDDEGNVMYKSSREEPVKELKNFRFMKNITPRWVNVKNKKILEPVPRNYEYERSMRKFEKEMRIWILHHQQTIRFFEKLKNIFTPIATLQLMYVVFYTCFTAFHLARARFGKDAAFLSLAASGTLIFLFAWSRIGFHIDATGSQLFSDAFDRPWYLLPKKIQKAFFLIILRGRSPLILKGLSLWRINLTNFAKVFRITYELFAFLLHVVHDE